MYERNEPYHLTSHPCKGTDEFDIMHLGMDVIIDRYRLIIISQLGPKASKDQSSQMVRFWVKKMEFHAWDGPYIHQTVEQNYWVFCLKYSCFIDYRSKTVKPQVRFMKWGWSPIYIPSFLLCKTKNPTSISKKRDCDTSVMNERNLH
jgi:hypothetical protein